MMNLINEVKFNQMLWYTMYLVKKTSHDHSGSNASILVCKYQSPANETCDCIFMNEVWNLKRNIEKILFQEEVCMFLWLLLKEIAQ